MDFHTFSQDIESKHCLKFSSIEENKEWMQKLNVDHQVLQIGAGNFECALAEKTVGNINFVSDRYSTSVAVSLSLPENMMCFMIPRTPSDNFIVNGNRSAKKVVSLLTNADGINIKSDGVSGADSILLTKEHFNALGQTISPAEHKQSFTETMNGFNKEQSLPFWGDVFGNIVKGNSPDNHLFTIEENVENMFSLFLDWTLKQKLNSVSDYPDSKQRRKQIAKRAQEYIHSFYRTKITLQQLCNITGAGLRTLQRCFKESFGLTINKYIYFVRLNQAYKYLVQSKGTKTSIGNLAHSLGFTHLGRFSTDFKKLFHISPTELISL